MTGYNPTSHRGFTLLIAVILSSIAATVTLSLTTLAYKGLLLSSAAQESQFAFYASDSSLECALYWDNSNDDPNTGATRKKFPLAGGPASQTIACGGVNVTVTKTTISASDVHYDSGWYTTPTGRCGQFSVYKTSTEARLYSNGTNVACSGGQPISDPRAISRSLQAYYAVQ